MDRYNHMRVSIVGPKRTVTLLMPRGGASKGVHQGWCNLLSTGHEKWPAMFMLESGGPVVGTKCALSWGALHTFSQAKAWSPLLQMVTPMIGGHHQRGRPWEDVCREWG